MEKHYAVALHMGRSASGRKSIIGYRILSLPSKTVVDIGKGKVAAAIKSGVEFYNIGLNGNGSTHLTVGKKDDYAQFENGVITNLVGRAPKCIAVAHDRENKLMMLSDWEGRVYWVSTKVETNTTQGAYSTVSFASELGGLIGSKISIGIRTDGAVSKAVQSATTTIAGIIWLESAYTVTGIEWQKDAITSNELLMALLSTVKLERDSGSSDGEMINMAIRKAVSMGDSSENTRGVKLPEKGFALSKRKLVEQVEVYLVVDKKVPDIMDIWSKDAIMSDKLFVVHRMVQTERVLGVEGHVTEEGMLKNSSNVAGKAAGVSDDGTLVVDGIYKGVDAGAFEGCDNIKKVIFEEGVQVIGEEAFRDCVNLHEIEFSSTIRYIGTCAFAGSGAGKIVGGTVERESIAVLPRGSSVELGGSLFGASAFTKVVVPGKMSAYRGLSNALKSYGVRGLIIEERGPIDIPDDFMRATVSLEVISFPNGWINTVGDSAFAFSKSLRKVDVSNAIVVGERAFCDCINYGGVIELNKVEVIGKLAFCTGGRLKIKLNVEKTPKIADSAFVTKEGNSEKISIVCKHERVFRELKEKQSNTPLWYGMKIESQSGHVE